MVPRLCAACISPEREAFEAAVASGISVRAAAKTAGLKYDAATSHIRTHDLTVRKPMPVSPIVETFTKASGHAPMPWQVGMLGETRDTLLLKGRQVGATETASALTIDTARRKPGSTSVIISPSQRQSSEVTVRARLGLWQLGETLRQDSASLLRLANGSRIVSLPGSARGIRGYAADLAILDEAAWLSAETVAAARPLTAATGGRMIIQSTPGSPVGPFYELATNPPEGWAFLRVRSDEVPTISPEFLERERREMSPDLYRQEYEAEFGEGTGGLFTIPMIDALFETA